MEYIMFKRILGNKKSIQRSLVISFIISIVLVITLSVIEFFVFIDPYITNKFIEINIHNQEHIREIIYIVRRSLGFTIVNVILISIILIRINMKKMLQPLTQINEATKKVAKGDYDIELETKREDEIGELTQNFNKMIKGLKSTENLQKEFINNVSHEIRTPISSIEGFAQILKDNSLSQEEREEYTNIIIEESERLINLTGKMLKLSKLHNQNVIVNKKEIWIDEQIRKAVSVLEPKWKEKNINISVKLEPKTFLGDEDLIFQVWINLIENAIKFSNNGGTIEIKVYEEKNNITVMIKDYGIGMSENEIEKAFERFYQIDKLHAAEGSGLGLAIVKRIIELSSGEIEIKSKSQQGTTIYIKLPIQNEKSNKVIIT